MTSLGGVVAVRCGFPRRTCKGYALAPGWSTLQTGSQHLIPLNVDARGLIQCVMASSPPRGGAGDGSNRTSHPRPKPRHDGRWRRIERHQAGPSARAADPVAGSAASGHTCRAGCRCKPLRCAQMRTRSGSSTSSGLRAWRRQVRAQDELTLQSSRLESTVGLSHLLEGNPPGYPRADRARRQETEQPL
jgi:hypothetical protein